MHGFNFRLVAPQVPEPECFDYSMSDKLIDALLKDDPLELSAILDKVDNKDLCIGRTIKKLPSILNDHPKLFAVSAFLKAEECCSFLKNLDFSVTHQDTSGRMVQHFAAAGGSLAIFRDLEENYKPDQNIDTPAHYAAMFGNTDIIRHMLSRSAKVDTFNKNGWKPIHFAAKYGHLDTVKFLISSGDKPDTTTKKMKYTPLHLAAQGGHGDVTEYLLKSGANMNARTSKKKTAMVFACENGSLSVIKVLIKHGAEYKAGHRVFIPLVSAASWGHLDVVQYLVKIGTPIDIEDTNNCTPVSGACQGGHGPVIKWLISKGAKFNVYQFFQTINSDLSLLDFYVKNINLFNEETHYQFFRLCVKYNRVELMREFSERLPDFKLDYHFLVYIIAMVAKQIYLNNKSIETIEYLIEAGEKQNLKPNILTIAMEVGSPDFFDYAFKKGIIKLTPEIIKERGLVSYALEHPRMNIFEHLKPFHPEIPNNWLYVLISHRSTHMHGGSHLKDDILNALSMDPPLDFEKGMIDVMKESPGVVVQAFADAGYDFNRLNQLHISSKNVISILQKAGVDFSKVQTTAKCFAGGTPDKILMYIISLCKEPLDEVANISGIWKISAPTFVTVAQKCTNVVGLLHSTLFNQLAPPVKKFAAELIIGVCHIPEKDARELRKSLVNLYL